MLQDICNDCYNNGYSAARKNTVLEVTEIIRIQLHKFVISKEIVYIDDIINLLETVKHNVLHEETHSSKGISTHS